MEADGQRVHWASVRWYSSSASGWTSMPLRGRLSLPAAASRTLAWGHSSGTRGRRSAPRSGRSPVMICGAGEGGRKGVGWPSRFWGPTSKQHKQQDAKDGCPARWHAAAERRWKRRRAAAGARLPAALQASKSQPHLPHYDSEAAGESNWGGGGGHGSREDGEDAAGQAGAASGATRRKCRAGRIVGRAQWLQPATA